MRSRAAPVSVRGLAVPLLALAETTVTDGIIPILPFKSARKVKAGLFVTATATNDATGNTSEFSAAKKVSGWEKPDAKEKTGSFEEVAREEAATRAYPMGEMASGRFRRERL
jgi:hypothetical protein